MRLDQAVVAKFPAISRRKARDLISAGRVLVNQRSVRVASREVAAGDELTVAEELQSVTVLAIHDEWLAVNKPAGMPTQPQRDRASLSLEEILRVEHRTIWLVHRLDTPTSGVVVFARTQPAAATAARARTDDPNADREQECANCCETAAQRPDGDRPAHRSHASDPDSSLIDRTSGRRRSTIRRRAGFPAHASCLEAAARVDRRDRGAAAA